MIYEVVTIVGIIIGLLTSILAYVIKLIKNKNNIGLTLLDELLALMMEAERLLSNGCDKKEYVLKHLKDVSNKYGINISDNDAGALIEILVDLTKKVNIKEGNKNEEENN